jgi:hypothetical protein
MPEGRPSIPAEVERAVKMEAGFRCAIPACRQYPTDIAHIVPWARVQAHEFGNLILLCTNCHRRYDGGEIDRTAMRGFKANLGLLNARYGEVERRLLEYFGTTYREDRETWEHIKQQGGAAAMALALPPAESDHVSHDPTFTRGVPLVATVSFGQEFLLSYLIKDGHLVRLPSPEFGLLLDGYLNIIEAYALTDSGIQLVEQFIKGEPLS